MIGTNAEAGDEVPECSDFFRSYFLPSPLATRTAPLFAGRVARQVRKITQQEKRFHLLLDHDVDAIRDRLCSGRQRLAICLVICQF